MNEIRDVLRHFQSTLNWSIAVPGLEPFVLLINLWKIIFNSCFKLGCYVALKWLKETNQT
jgi:hypothetical protein